MPVILSRTGNGVFDMHTIPLYNSHLRITKTVNTVYYTAPQLNHKCSLTDNNAAEHKLVNPLCLTKRKPLITAATDSLYLASNVIVSRLYLKMPENNHKSIKMSNSSASNKKCKNIACRMESNLTNEKSEFASQKMSQYAMYEMSVVAERKEELKQTFESLEHAELCTEESTQPHNKNATPCFIVKIRRSQLSEMQFAYSIAESINCNIPHKVLQRTIRVQQKESVLLSCEKETEQEQQQQQEQEEEQSLEQEIMKNTAASNECKSKDEMLKTEHENGDEEKEEKNQRNKHENDELSDVVDDKKTEEAEITKATWAQLLTLLFQSQKATWTKRPTENSCKKLEYSTTSIKSVENNEELKWLSSWQLRVLNTRAVVRFSGRQIALPELSKHFITPELETTNERICFLSSPLEKMFTICRTSVLYVFAQYDKLDDSNDTTTNTIISDYRDEVDLEDVERQRGDEKSKEEEDEDGRTQHSKELTSEHNCKDMQTPTRKTEFKHQEKITLPSPLIAHRIISTPHAPQKHYLHRHINKTLENNYKEEWEEEYLEEEEEESATISNDVSILDKVLCANECVSGIAVVPPLPSPLPHPSSAIGRNGRELYKQNKSNKCIYNNMAGLSPTRRLVYPKSHVEPHKARKQTILNQMLSHSWTFKSLIKQLQLVHVQGKELMERLQFGNTNEFKDGDKKNDIINKSKKINIIYNELNKALCVIDSFDVSEEYQYNSGDGKTKQIRGGWSLSLLDLLCEMTLISSAELILQHEHSHEEQDEEAKRAYSKKIILNHNRRCISSSNSRSSRNTNEQGNIDDMVESERWLQLCEVAARRLWKCAKSLYWLTKTKERLHNIKTQSINAENYHNIMSSSPDTTYFPHKLFTILLLSMYLRSLRHLLLCLALQGQLKQAVFIFLLLLEMQNIAEELHKTAQELFINQDNHIDTASKKKEAICNTLEFCYELFCTNKDKDGDDEDNHDKEDINICDLTGYKCISYSAFLCAILSLCEVAACLPSSYLQHKANLFDAAVHLLQTCNFPEVNYLKEHALILTEISNDASHHVQTEITLTSRFSHSKYIKADNNNSNNNGIIEDVNNNIAKCQEINVRLPSSLQKYLFKHDILRKLMTYTMKDNYINLNKSCTSNRKLAKTHKERETQQEEEKEEEQVPNSKTVHEQRNQKECKTKSAVIQELAMIANYSVSTPTLNSFTAFDVRFRQNLHLYNRVIKHKLYS